MNCTHQDDVMNIDVEMPSMILMVLMRVPNDTIMIMINHAIITL